MYKLYKKIASVIGAITGEISPLCLNPPYSSTQYIQLTSSNSFFFYFNEFLFCYVLHFFYTLTYEHVGKIQKNGKEN